MKKVLLSLTLFIASFFFVSLNIVKADTLDFIIPEHEFSILESDEFKFLREEVIKIANDNNQYYIISFNGNDQSDLIAYVFDKTDISLSFTSRNLITPKHYSFISVSIYRINDITNTFELSGTNTYITDELRYNSNNGQVFTYLRYADSNIPHYSFDYPDRIVNLTYNDFNYSISSNEHFPSLYEIYNLINKGESDEPVILDKFTEEIENMNNFYSTLFTKISELANNLANNYTFLLILGIFILIFVFELIWRRFI